MARAELDALFDFVRQRIRLGVFFLFGLALAQFFGRPFPLIRRHGRMVQTVFDFCANGLLPLRRTAEQHEKNK